MGTVEVKDSLIWVNHIHDDPALKNTINSMHSRDQIELEVASFRGVWEKVSDNRNTDKSVAAIKPIFSAKANWNSLQRGITVPLQILETEK